MMTRMLHKFWTKCKFCTTFHNWTSIKMPSTTQNAHSPTQMSTTLSILSRINPFHTFACAFIGDVHLVEFFMRNEGILSEMFKNKDKSSEIYRKFYEQQINSTINLPHCAVCAMATCKFTTFNVHLKMIYIKIIIALKIENIVKWKKHC